jgi:hypothetical protein
MPRKISLSPDPAFRYVEVMTPAEFKRKWQRYSGKETAAYQEHFNDLCAVLGQPTPAAAEPTGSESFCFQKRSSKIRRKCSNRRHDDRGVATSRFIAGGTKTRIIQANLRN